MPDYITFLQELKESNVSLFIACTGAGAGLQNVIWEEPGISNVLVGSAFPYDKFETDDFLGFTSDKYVSEETAMNMAIESFIKAKTVCYKNNKWNRKCIGLGLSASVASEKAHRGDHRIFVCTVSDTGVTSCEVTLEKGVGREARIKDGKEADRLAVGAIWAQISTGFGIMPEYIVLDKCFWDMPVFAVNGRHTSSFNSIKFPGSFNPPHVGHFDMAQRASLSMCNQGIDFLINTDNPHKAHVGTIECLCRVAMFRARPEFAQSKNTVQFTKGQPLFVDKVREFPTCKFILGGDTLQTILDPKWGISKEDVLKQIPNRSLIVFPRHMGKETIGVFTASGSSNCEGKVLIEHKASLNISSTDIRLKRACDNALSNISVTH